MSFSGTIKKELAGQLTRRRHCQIAELAAMTGFGGHIFQSPAGTFRIAFQCENLDVAKKYCTLMKKCFNIYADVLVRLSSSTRKNRTYLIYIQKKEDCFRILQAFKLFDGQDTVQSFPTFTNPLLLQNTCCKRAFLRGAFLLSGSMSDPRKSYHLEIVCDTKEQAVQLRALMQEMDLNARIVSRKKQFVVYLKEGEQIVDTLNLMEAHISLMELENIRILRDIANTINRQTNCDVANSQKTVTASKRQREDIRLIQKVSGLSSLPAGLQEIAELRLEYPDLPIRDLGQMLSPPIGKSGVNHRLRKLSQIANELRG